MSSQAGPCHFRGTITSLAPLQATLDGDTSPINTLRDDRLVDLAVGDRVYAVRLGGQILVLGRWTT